MSQSKSKEIVLLLAAFGGSAIILTVIQVPFNLHFLAWVAFVPFILVCSPKVKTWQLCWTSYLVGSCYWLGNLYWIGYVTAPAYVLFCLYLGLYWPLLGLLIRYCRRKKLSLFLMVPLLFCGAEAWQGILVTGFSWRLLGQSQYSNLALIQIADIFGQLGISVIIAAVNGLVAELIIDGRGSRLFRPANYLKTLITAIILIGALLYGNWRINQTDEFTEPGPVAGVVQSNVPSLVKEQAESSDAILSDLIEQSTACMDAGAKFVLWPETMVLTTINIGYLNLCIPQSKPLGYHEKISLHCKDRGYVLFGAHAADFKPEGLSYKLTDKYNSAFLYRPDGRQGPQRYDKIHLIPFGEYIPFKNSLPFIYNLIIKLSPYDYDYNLTKGKQYTTFKITDNEQTYSFGVLICYEDTDAEVARKMVIDDTGRKKTDFLVNISNDGWYVRYKDEKVLPSVELAQRTVITVFRSVENRISILRSVNTGISCLIDSTGRIRDGFTAGNLPQNAMVRQGVAGWFIDTIPVDKRVTFFSKHGQWLKFFYAGALIIVIIIAVIDRVAKKGSSK